MEQQIIDYLLTLIPAITAVLTALGAMIAVVVQIRRVVKDNQNYVERENRLARQEIRQVLRENAELKQELSKTLNMLYNVKGKPDGKKKTK